MSNTMTTVINFKQEKARRRRFYLTKHGCQLDQFIATFLANHLNFGFVELAYAYQAHQNKIACQSWDYLDLREMMFDLVRDHFASQLYQELCQQNWFDARLISKEQIIERCVPIFVLGQSVVANQ